MKYIVLSIDNHIQEFLFIIEYPKGANKIVLGELIKLSNLCYIKDFNFDFFEVIEDPTISLSKEGIYIYKYDSFSDVLHRLNIKLTSTEIRDLKMTNKEIFHLMTQKNKAEILSIIHSQGKYHEIFKKMFDINIKKK